MAPPKAPDTDTDRLLNDFPAVHNDLYTWAHDARVDKGRIIDTLLNTLQQMYGLTSSGKAAIKAAKRRRVSLLATPQRACESGSDSDRSSATNRGGGTPPRAALPPPSTPP
ncbi:hypothetical protein TeGR_g6434, partial [Tetraparma gracilis]